jgi:hypothetical protein
VQLVAERDGRVIATARSTPPDEDTVVGEIAGDAAGIRAILATAAAQGEATVIERPGTSLDGVLDDIATPTPMPDRNREWFYSRVDAVAPRRRRRGRAGVLVRRRHLLRLKVGRSRAALCGDGLRRGSMAE